MSDRTVVIFLVLLFSVGIESYGRDYFYDYHWRPSYYDSGNQCEAELEEIKTSIKNLESLTIAVGKAVNPDFKWEPAGNKNKCPTGFQSLPGVENCYKVVYENHNWTSASARCQEMVNGAHLVSITSQAESDSLKTFLRKELAKNSRIHVCTTTIYNVRGKKVWTSGQRLDATQCNDSFVWKDTSYHVEPLEYTNWMDHEPNCKYNSEHCLYIEPAGNYKWNDLDCDELLCPLCEYELPRVVHHENVIPQ